MIARLIADRLNDWNAAACQRWAWWDAADTRLMRRRGRWFRWRAAADVRQLRRVARIAKRVAARHAVRGVPA